MGQCPCAIVVEGVTARRPLGLVSITSPNFRDGYAYLSAVGTPEAQGSGLIAQGVLLGFNYAFLTWPFRKIYMEVSETSYEAFRSGLRNFFTEEGHLREHAFWDGRYVDVFVLAVYRATWADRGPRLVKRLASRMKTPNLSTHAKTDATQVNRELDSKAPTSHA